MNLVIRSESNLVDWEQAANIYKGTDLADIPADELKSRFEGSEFVAYGFNSDFTGRRAVIAMARADIEDGKTIVRDLCVMKGFEGFAAGSDVLHYIKNYSKMPMPLVLSLEDPAAEKFYKTIEIDEYLA